MYTIRLVTPLGIVLDETVTDDPPDFWSVIQINRLFSNKGYPWYMEVTKNEKTQDAIQT